jgi:hypothetical protein
VNETAHAIGHAERELRNGWRIYLAAAVGWPLGVVFGAVLVIGVLAEAGWQWTKERMRR